MNDLMAKRNHRWENNTCIHCGIKRTKKTFRYLMAITNNPPYDHYKYEQGYVYEDGEQTWFSYKPYNSYIKTIKQ